MNLLPIDMIRIMNIQSPINLKIQLASNLYLYIIYILWHIYYPFFYNFFSFGYEITQ